MCKMENFDVIVVGCGIAGICAALEATDRGAKVLVIDRDYGGVADIYVVFAVTDPNSKNGTSAFIVESGFEGFSVGKKERKLGIRSSPTTEIIFENCRVPKENLLGEERQAGRTGEILASDPGVGCWHLCRRSAVGHLLRYGSVHGFLGSGRTQEVHAEGHGGRL